VTKVTTDMNLVTPKAAAEHELLFNKLASDLSVVGSQSAIYLCLISILFKSGSCLKEIISSVPIPLSRVPCFLYLPWLPRCLSKPGWHGDELERRGRRDRDDINQQIYDKRKTKI